MRSPLGSSSRPFSFLAAYAGATGSLLILFYLFALAQLARSNTWRQRCYSGLAVGLLIAVFRPAFFWHVFSAGSVALWYVFAFWIGLFVGVAGLCLKRLGAVAGFLLMPFLWTGRVFPQRVLLPEVLLAGPRFDPSDRDRDLRLRRCQPCVQMEAYSWVKRSRWHQGNFARFLWPNGQTLTHTPQTRVPMPGPALNRRVCLTHRLK